jgi:hypothetical protein
MLWSLLGQDVDLHPVDRPRVMIRTIPRDPKAGMESCADGNLVGLMGDIRMRGLISLARIMMLGICILTLLLRICGFCMLMACLLPRLRRGHLILRIFCCLMGRWVTGLVVALLGRMNVLVWLVRWLRRIGVVVLMVCFVWRLALRLFFVRLSGTLLLCVLRRSNLGIRMSLVPRVATNMVAVRDASRMMMVESDVDLVALHTVDLIMGLTRHGGCVLLLRDTMGSVGTGYH